MRRYVVECKTARARYWRTVIGGDWGFVVTQLAATIGRDGLPRPGYFYRLAVYLNEVLEVAVPLDWKPKP